jgi:hypothetical protein
VELSGMAAAPMGVPARMTWCAPLRRAQGFRVKLNSAGARCFWRAPLYYIATIMKKKFRNNNISDY